MTRLRAFFAAFICFFIAGLAVADGVAPVTYSRGPASGSGGDVTLAPVGSSPNVNGASISASQVLNLQPASNTTSGALSHLGQVVGGAKVFDGGVYVTDVYSVANDALYGNSSIYMDTASVDLTTANSGSTTAFTLRANYLTPTTGYLVRFKSDASLRVAIRENGDVTARTFAATDVAPADYDSAVSGTMNVPSGSLDNVLGGYFSTTVQNGATVRSPVGIEADLYIDGTVAGSPSPGGVAVQGYCNVGATGTTPFCAALQAAPAANAGTLTTNYGLLIENQRNIGTTNYAIFAKAGAGDSANFSVNANTGAVVAGGTITGDTVTTTKATSEAVAIQLVQDTKLCLGTSGVGCFFYDGTTFKMQPPANKNASIEVSSGKQLQNTGGYQTGDVAPLGASFHASAGSGYYAFAADTVGARTDFGGTGGSDYVTSDNTTVTFAGPTILTGTTIGATGTKIDDSYAGSASIDFAGVTDGCEDSSGITVTGAAVGDVCAVGPPATLPSTASWVMCWVSATNTVKVRHCAHGASGDPGAGTYNVRVFDP